MNNPKTVFVGLSGGVDSSVAALRLKNQGYNVVGVFIKVWHPDFMVCDWEMERLDAMRVAAHLDIPFLTCDAEADYRDEVAHYFIEEYREGRTPNPDVMCNQHVKFGAFLRFAKERKADFIATGHYARRIEGPSGAELHRGVDPNKDQTYFLWTLSNKQLEYSLFPVGDTPKEEIRLEAEAAGIPTATKKDSQGVCFLGHVDIPDFLSHYIDLKVGNVLDMNGNVVGKHKGALVYTTGQRHGFTLNTADPARTEMFIVDRNLKQNTITVSSKRPVTEKTSNFKLINSVLREPIVAGETVSIQTRYRQVPFEALVNEVEENSIVISPTSITEKPALGQSCVLYKDELCLGGGMLT
ncbi:tRNA 2-thiouridine(34) synthase MnmA [Candidatus Nomurabacteria bacterium]|nr:tRNA 2-thiouridine(34) synthase MnmA [Candidatus Kaiserbacteria bacterium]MCB9813927.1 tRNA 2-thiouridine(34) synthase MnmA [Candidatus Nomurabacteria bacterium]